MSATDVLYYGSVIPRLEGYDGGLMAADEGSATSSLVLLERIRSGDSQALNRLVQRYLPPLTRWARGRLPRWARDLSDTDDLVQDALMRTVRQLDRFEPRRDGALHAYLRSAIMNRIRDEIRRRRRTPVAGPLDATAEARSADRSPLEEIIGKELLEKYDRALDQLDPEARDVVIARIELGCSYAEIAETFGRTSADAVRKSVSRALVRLAQEMRDARSAAV
jgi:RNA polymerase sigma factor (sigma-70 family)